MPLQIPPSVVGDENIASYLSRYKKRLIDIFNVQGARASNANPRSEAVSRLHDWDRRKLKPLRAEIAAAREEVEARLRLLPQYAPRTDGRDDLDPVYLLALSGRSDPQWDLDDLGGLGRYDDPV